MQAQNTPVNNMFDFSIGDIEVNEASSAVSSSAPLPDDIKKKLHGILQLLGQDVSSLVQDAEPIRNIFKQIKAIILDDILEALTPIAFIETRKSK